MPMEGRTYDYRLTKTELAELALRLTLDSFIMGKWVYLIITALGLAANLMPYLILFLTSGPDRYPAILLSLPSALLSLFRILLPFFFSLILLRFLLYLFRFSRQPIPARMRLHLENGCLCEDSAAITYQGASFTAFVETPRLLLLKRDLARKSYSYLALPKRIFSGAQEIQAFKTYLRTTAVQPPAPASSFLFHFSFHLSPDDFAHVYTELMRLARLHRPFWRNSNTLTALFLCVFITGIMILLCLSKGDHLGFLSLTAVGLFLIASQLSAAASIREDVYRSKIRQNRFPINGTGPWDLTFYPTMVSVRCEQDAFDRQLDSYTHFYETVDTLFLLRLENGFIKQYLFLPKWALSCREEHDAFTAFCRSMGKNPEFVHIPEVEDSERMLKKARRRTALLWLALGIFLLGVMGFSILSGYQQAAR